MIRVRGQDCHGPIELLGEEGADELVRPGHRAEGEAKRGLFKQGFAVPVRAADGKHDVADAAVAIARQAGGEGAAVEIFSALVERDQFGARAKRFEKRGGFLRLARRRVGGAAFRSLAKGEGEREFPAGGSARDR